MQSPLPLPSLIVLIGPSSSGKSTWALENFALTDVVSSDHLRSVVGIDESDQRASTVAFELLSQIVSERLKRKLTTVVDTTGLDASRRKEWLAAADEAGVPAHAVIFEADLDTCLSRNEKRDTKRPRSVIQKQHRQMEKTRAEVEAEGFAGILAETPIRPAAPRVAAEASRPPSTRDSGSSGHTFGLMVSRFAWDDAPVAETLAGIATRAEAAGFRDLWLMDHLRQIRSVGRAWEDILEPYTALSYVAGVTSRIRLGCLVTAIDHRHPAILAKSVATLDVLSGGRANCGLGIGWDREEHQSYGIPFLSTGDRYAMLEEAIEVLRLMWGKGTPEFSGRFFDAEALACYPRPLQDPPPILIGGSGEKRTLRLVAKHADAANVFGTPDRVTHKVSVLERHCKDVGRDPAEIEVTHLMNAFTAPDARSLREAGDRIRPREQSYEDFIGRHNGALPADLIGMFSAYHTAGAPHSIVAIPGAHLEGTIESFAAVIAGMT